MSDIYRLVTVADLLTIPIDKLPACLRDLEYAIMLTHFAGGEHTSAMTFDYMDWTDDDHSVNMSLNGEPLLSLKVTKGGGNLPPPLGSGGAGEVGGG